MNGHVNTKCKNQEGNNAWDIDILRIIEEGERSK